jgi:glycosyltransferase involved in cell wall biosynthesis
LLNPSDRAGRGAAPDDRPLAVLLDLAGNRRRATEWAQSQLPDCRIQTVNKAELKWESKSAALARIRSLNPGVFAVFAADLRIQSGRSLITLFGAAAGARRILFGDARGVQIQRSRLSAALLDVPRLVFEFAAGYLVLIPVSWILVWLLRLALNIRRHDPTSRAGSSSRASGEPLHALYLRATLVPGDAESGGGLASHVAGFVSGALSLGHQLTLITSGDSGVPTRDAVAMEVAPSSLVAATRSLLELHNNLTFTIATLRQDRALFESADFIYQRYSRFNFTGVVLSLVTGLPLLLEFNGSEVWVSKYWDPVGQIGLLKRFEKLNLQADLIFVVSETQRRSVLEEGVEGRRIVVNPNSVDTDVFRSGDRGGELRDALRIADRTVVGFLGTFGPWHGATVLAEAATRVAHASQFHFLFIGDGEQRALAEEILKRASNGAAATFVGRLSRSEVPAYLEACDILVSPQTGSPDGSEFFGSPTKLFEYMAMARPIVASRAGQIAEVIVDGESGLLVEPGEPGAIATALERLAGDRSLRARLGLAARARVESEFTWRHNAQRVFEAARLYLSGELSFDG